MYLNEALNPCALTGLIGHGQPCLKVLDRVRNSDFIPKVLIEG